MTCSVAIRGFRSDFVGVRKDASVLATPRSAHPQKRCSSFSAAALLSLGLQVSGRVSTIIFRGRQSLLDIIRKICYLDFELPSPKLPQAADRDGEGPDENSAMPDLTRKEAAFSIEWTTPAICASSYEHCV